MSAASINALSRFSRPSVRGMPIGNWDPVKITGFRRPSSMKLKAEAVYAMVSVPWSTTKPSKRSMHSMTVDAMPRQCLGATSLLSMGVSNDTASTRMPAWSSSGTCLDTWLKSKGTRAPLTLSRTMPTVPPV